MNKATEIFKEILDVIEFELVKRDNGYGLVDLQGVNLGDIESDRFWTAAQIIERLDVCINDYYLSDLEDEAEGCGLLDSVIALGLGDESTKSWLDLAEKFKGDPEVDKFVENHKHDFDVLDLIANHIEEVKLEELVGGERNDMQKVHIVSSTFDDGCIRLFIIEGVYRSREGAQNKFNEIVNTSDWFTNAEEPVIEERFACSSKDYKEEKWLEVYIIEEEVHED